MTNLEIEKLKEELRRKNQLIENLTYNVERIDFLLYELIEDYSFYERPTPWAAVEWAKTMDNDDENGQQSFKWFCEYSRIHELIQIAKDYAIDSREQLERGND